MVVPPLTGGRMGIFDKLLNLPQLQFSPLLSMALSICVDNSQIHFSNPDLSFEFQTPASKHNSNLTKANEILLICFQGQGPRSLSKILHLHKWHHQLNPFSPSVLTSTPMTLFWNKIQSPFQGHGHLLRFLYLCLKMNLAWPGKCTKPLWSLSPESPPSDSSSLFPAVASHCRLSRFSKPSLVMVFPNFL